jgi:hypothetical protein
MGPARPRRVDSLLRAVRGEGEGVNIP